MAINPYQSPAENDDALMQRHLHRPFAIAAFILGGLAALLWWIIPIPVNPISPETAARLRIMHLLTGALVGGALTSAVAWWITAARPRTPLARNDGPKSEPR